MSEERLLVKDVRMNFLKKGIFVGLCVQCENIEDYKEALEFIQQASEITPDLPE